MPIHPAILIRQSHRHVRTKSQQRHTDLFKHGVHTGVATLSARKIVRFVIELDSERDLTGLFGHNDKVDAFALYLNRRLKICFAITRTYLNQVSKADLRTQMVSLSQLPF